MKAVGWIRAEESERAALVALGVSGDMIYNPKHNCFEYCTVTDEHAMFDLIRLRPSFSPTTFTLMDESGNQLPKHQQRYWRMPGQNDEKCKCGNAVCTGNMCTDCWKEAYA